MNSNLQFPRTVRACKAHDLGQWAVADALLKEVSEKDLAAAVVELAENGIEHTARYLNMLRQTAEVFPPSRRHEGVTLRAHVAAGNPDSLDVIVRAGRKAGRTVSLEFVENVLRQMRALAKEAARDERKRAAEEEREAEKEEREAQTLAERAAAKAKREKARAKRKAVKSPKRKDLPAPNEEDVNPLETRAQFMKNANEARRLASQSLKLIKPVLSEYSPAAVAGLTDAALTVANTWRETANTLGTAAIKGGKGLLSVVNE